MSPSELMVAMAAAGAPFEAIVIAVKALEQEREAMLERLLAHSAQPAPRERTSAAERQKRYRERKAAAAKGVTSDASVTVCDASVMHGDGCVTAGDAVVTVGDGAGDASPSLPLPPNEINSNPPAPTHPEGFFAREAVPFDAHVAARNEALAAGWKPKRKRKPASSPSVEIPDWIPAEPWAAFLEMRKRKGAPPTDRAIVLLIGKLEKFRASGQDPGAVLDQSTVKNWTDLYELKDRNDGHRQADWGSAPSNRPDRRDAISRAIDDELGQHGMDFGGPAQPARQAGRADDGQPRIGRLVRYTPS